MELPHHTSALAGLPSFRYSHGINMFTRAQLEPAQKIELHYGNELEPLAWFTEAIVHSGRQSSLDESGARLGSPPQQNKIDTGHPSAGIMQNPPNL